MDPWTTLTSQTNDFSGRLTLWRLTECMSLKGICATCTIPSMMASPLQSMTPLRELEKWRKHLALHCIALHCFAFVFDSFDLFITLFNYSITCHLLACNAAVGTQLWKEVSNFVFRTAVFMKHQFIGSPAKQHCHWLRSHALMKHSETIKQWNNGTMKQWQWDIGTFSNLQFVSCKPNLECFRRQLVPANLPCFSPQVVQSWHWTVGLSGDRKEVCNLIIVSNFPCDLRKRYTYTSSLFCFTLFCVFNLCLHLTWLDFDLRKTL